ncbi:FAD/NAD(P)-binding domain-containing protein [Exidia glandulosa HHB12029]|uniref:FAD/NAD(P)-binding domain-containing protein n=1 Tax=Exidia glandulosa HHB12029 TaxID=1314781 RepID=A0A165ZAF9_EXIGL|nr:FAD/NAD(P)-binding domain-containing protein [Exidia glandulosa HHB12029]
MVQNVVIVGAGPAGITIALQLAPKLDPSKHQLILISERPFFSHIIAGLRANVTTDGQLEDRAFLPLDKFFRPGRPGKFVQGRVERADGEHVYLENGESIPYAALIITTGSNWRGMLNFPHTKEELHKSLDTWREKFKTAKSVLIIGGGAVGLELAGEVLEYYPKTEVTLVHGQKLLLNPAYPDSFRKRLGDQFTKAGVKVLLDQTVLDVTADLTADLTGPVKTSKGEELNADVIIQAVGPTPNTTVVATLDPSVITPDSRVKVLPTLQVPLASGKRNVFVAGDIVDIQEQHSSIRAAAHAPIVVANVLSVLNGKDAAKKYKSGPEIIMLTRGKTGGLGYAGFLCGLTFPSWLVGTLKGKDLLTNLTHKTLGY